MPNYTSTDRPTSGVFVVFITVLFHLSILFPFCIIFEWNKPCWRVCLLFTAFIALIWVNLSVSFLTFLSSIIVIVGILKVSDGSLFYMIHCSVISVQLQATSKSFFVSFSSFLLSSLFSCSPFHIQCNSAYGTFRVALRSAGLNLKFSYLWCNSHTCHAISDQKTALYISIS